MALIDQVLQYSAIVLLVMLSGLFSGLTLGLLSLDKVGLQIVIKGGEESESRYARQILPIRRKGNLLLCTLLLGNVAVNSLLSILMAGITSGAVGFLTSTAAIVIFGEIVPQSVCSRHALLIGAKTTWLVYLFLVLLFPIAYPISVLLDWVLGAELGTIYSRRELQTLLSITSASAASDLESQELIIMQGALNYRSKTARQVMTPLDDVFMLDSSGVLNVETLSEVLSQGFSRVPVYEATRNNIVGLLFVKDLILLSPDEATPLSNLLKLFSRNLPRVHADTTLDRMLSQFKSGRSHIALVHEVNNEGPGDPFYENIGICTLEDVIEEIIQQEILDETDLYETNKAALFSRPDSVKELTDDQLTAVTRVLSASPSFAAPKLTPTALRWLVRASSPALLARDSVLYRRGERAHACTLILSGRFEVRSGADAFVSQSSAFECLALSSLADHAHNADFTARAMETSLVLRIPFRVYARARRASRLTARGADIASARLLETRFVPLGDEDSATSSVSSTDEHARRNAMDDAASSASSLDDGAI